MLRRRLAMMRILPGKRRVASYQRLARSGRQCRTKTAILTAIVDLEDSSYRSTMAWKKDLPGPRVGFFASARRDAERGEARKVAGGGRPGGQRGRFA